MYLEYINIDIGCFGQKDCEVLVLSHDMSIHYMVRRMIQAKKISLIDDQTSWIEVSWEKTQERSLFNILQKNVIV